MAAGKITLVQHANVLINATLPTVMCALQPFVLKARIVRVAGCSAVPYMFGALLDAGVESCNMPCASAKAVAHTRQQAGWHW